MVASHLQLVNFLPEILINIFCHIDSIKELLRISTVCLKWRSIILDRWFLQHRFHEFTRSHFIGHWKFEDKNNLGHDSSGIIKDRYSFTGNPRQEPCFLGFCAGFNDQSSSNIPIYDLSLHETDHFCVSVWLCPSQQTYTYRTALGAWKPDGNH